MWALIIGAIVQLLVFFFEQWWTKHHPTRPTQLEKDIFLADIGRLRYIWMGPNRKKTAEAVFDQFVSNYDDQPPPKSVLDGHQLTASQAKLLAQRYAEGIHVTE